MKKYYVVVILMLLFLCSCTEVDHTGQIKIENDSNYYVGKNYKTVETELKNQGFSNIKLNKIEDLTSGFFYDDGEVDSISVDGKESFYKGKWFDTSSEIIIKYHTFKPAPKDYYNDSKDEYFSIDDVTVKKYSEDNHHNTIISIYNYLYDNEITSSMVTYERFNHTEVQFDDFLFVMSLSDNDDHFTCKSSLSYSEENEELFFEQVTKVIKATYPTLSENEINNEIIKKIRESNSGLLSGYLINGRKKHFSYRVSDGKMEFTYGSQSW